MLHPHTRLQWISKEIGFGVVATEFIPKGTIVWVLDALDQQIDDREITLMPHANRSYFERYAYKGADGRWILCWDHARFVNHSCAATCLGPGLDFEIAVRDIHPGEQITDDYGSLNLDEHMDCHCGASNCRGQVQPEDFENFADMWDQQVRSAFPLIGEVDQPLWPVVRQKDAVQRALGNPEAIPTIRLNSSRPLVYAADTGQALRASP